MEPQYRQENVATDAMSGAPDKMCEAIGLLGHADLPTLAAAVLCAKPE
jgi:hypothetical protein